MTDIATLIRAKALSEEILEAASFEDVERIQLLESARAQLLPKPADFDAIGHLSREQKEQMLALVAAIIQLNDAAQVKLAPLHEDLQAYTHRLDSIRRRYETDRPSLG